ncbi:MAG TPA: MBL fold metallo-hydrolase [Bacteroidota bacterium]|nr:MBL fold metallo-hydrolase [Bacteroidota bacterium]
MANYNKRLPGNVDGEFFVDSTCIDCDACRQLAPDVFREDGNFSSVYSQPKTGEERRSALRALLACPTGSIGTLEKIGIKEVYDDFPLAIEGDVSYCGFNSPDSFGGNSYFIRGADGNWLIDSPKFVHFLVKKFEQLGGIRRIFLTHRDDVADAEKFAQHFHAERIIHRYELSAQPDAEIVIEGDEPVQLEPDFLVVPTFGHTKGHCTLLYKNRFLFSGDHLWWSRNHQRLNAGRDVCWYDWRMQADSMARLLDHSFEWVLPGHGQKVKLPREEMKAQLSALVQIMTTPPQSVASFF